MNRTSQTGTLCSIALGAVLSALTTGAMAQSAAPAGDLVPGRSILKICKVAGPGVGVGTQFTFTPGGVSVPAGPAPGGYCVVAGSFPTGANVTVVEAGPAGYGVTNIGVAGNMIGAPDLAGKKVTVSMIPGVTEVTFTNEKRTGYIEICKAGDVRGNFTFRLPDGHTITVPAGACSPAMEIPAGSLTVTELPSAGSAMVGCSTFPAGRQGACNTGARTSTVTVVPGDISTMTVITINNRRTGIGQTPALGTTHGMIETPKHEQVVGDAAATTLSCTADDTKAHLTTCTAQVTSVLPDGGTPTGMVSFHEGEAIVAMIPIKDDGSATLALSTLSAGMHELFATYDGDPTFGPSASSLVDAEVEQR